MPTSSYFASRPRHPRRSLIAHLVAGTLLAPLAASAQQAPAVQEQAKQEAAKPAPVQAPPAQATAAPPAQTPVESTVTVSATRTQNRIDRQSYDVKADPATSNDTVADTLNKVPSVAVDADGNVTLRGRSNVQILVDGKPSAMMQGGNAAAVINALPASDLDSVEVINNPGAQFGNEGGGGPIINLVMRRERSPGGWASVNGNVGTEGRYNTSVNGGWTQGRYSLQGGLSRNVQKNESSSENRRERIDPVTGAIAPTLRSSTSENRSENTTANARLTYNLGDKDVIGVAANYTQNMRDSDSNNRYRSANAAGVVDSEYLRISTSDGKNRSYGLSASLDHKGEAPGEKFQMDLRISGSDNDSGSAGRYDYTVRPRGAGALADRQYNDTETRIVDFTGDYELPGERGVMKIGYKVARNSSAFDNAFFDIDPLTGTERPSTTRTNLFELTDMTYALYGTYQWRVNEKWGVLGGLRAEYADLDMNQVTTGQRASNHYFDAIPSAFVTYGLSDDTTLRLSYAHRIRRPGAGDLNPFVIYRDEQNISSGNPNLQPTNSDSLELGVETKLGKVDTTVRLYARRDSDLISERRFLQANDVLLTTRENAGSSRSGGLEFTFSGRATQQLTLNLSGNVGYSEQTVLGSVLDDKRSATSIGGRAFVNYQMDATNSFRLFLIGQGKTLFGEGYREPSYWANLNYSRRLTPALTLSVNINDLFDSQKTESFTETDRFREYSIRRNNGRMATIGLNYRFGSFGGPGGQRRPMMFGGPGGGRGPGGPGPGG